MRQKKNGRRLAQEMLNHTSTDKPLLTTSELAQMVGLSATFIRTEIKNGEIRAVRIGRGRKRVFRILAREAVRYARQLGVL